MLRRRALSAIAMTFCAGSVLLALVPLGFVLFFVVSQGLRSINLAFFTHLPLPVGEPGGGMANAIVGTLIVSGLAAAMAVPIGVLSGIYMAEYAGTRLAGLMRFAADTLNGVPSIVIGLFAYVVAVLPFRQFSASAGGFALGVIWKWSVQSSRQMTSTSAEGSARQMPSAIRRLVRPA